MLSVARISNNVGFSRRFYVVKRYAGKKDTTPVNWVGKTVLHEDNHLLVLNKPPTILMQKDATNDISLLELAKEYIKDKYDKLGEAYMGLVHRIDRPCSGVVVFAKTSKAAERLSKTFSERKADKKYICVVHGHVAKPGRCDNFLAPVANSNENKVRVVTPKLKDGATQIKQNSSIVEAKLAYTPVMTFSVGKSRPGSVPTDDRAVRTVLSVELFTGRKHQIRAQLAHIGHPICGDVKYGAPAWPREQETRVSERPGATSSNPTLSSSGATVRTAASTHGNRGVLPGVISAKKDAAPLKAGIVPYNGHGIALHSHTLVLPHPTTKEKMTFTAPLPDSWKLHFGEARVSAVEKAITAATTERKPILRFADMVKLA
jgi:23S rRNA pseudouridine1911/1915/1917 synthase